MDQKFQYSNLKAVYAFTFALNALYLNWVLNQFGGYASKLHRKICIKFIIRGM